GTSTSTGAPATSTTGPIDPSTTTTTFPATATSLPDTTGFDPPECNPVLKATIRDFKVSHPDFESYTGNAAYKGLVQPDLGPDKKPVYAHAGGTPQTTGPLEFAQWYNDVPNVNLAFEIEIPLTESMPGQFSFQDNTFFPIDDQGWGNEGNGHNFHFTTEIHTEFTYQGGEVFTFTGDDDLWLFINGKLAIDLGGTHPQLSDTIDLDANAGYFGIQIGGTYPMDIFHAERHTDESNFRIDTSIQCFIIPG
ncbi:MAG TPA: fibro-slime domain-containing protein, partial [Nannocystis sp.]